MPRQRVEQFREQFESSGTDHSFEGLLVIALYSRSICLEKRAECVTILLGFHTHEARWAGSGARSVFTAERQAKMHPESVGGSWTEQAEGIEGNVTPRLNDRSDSQSGCKDVKFRRDGITASARKFVKTRNHDWSMGRADGARATVLRSSNESLTSLPAVHMENSVPVALGFTPSALEASSPQSHVVGK